MFEKLIETLAALVRELKRYNDRRDITAPIDTTAAGADTAEVKAAPVKTAEKPAAKAKKAEPVLTLADVQSAGSDYITANSRDKFIAILRKNGVPAVDEGKGPAYKLSTIKDDLPKLTKIMAELTAAPVESEDGDL